jgi:hypothetical protein
MNDVRNGSRRIFARMRCCFVSVWLAPLHAADLPRTRVAGVRPGTGAVRLTVEAELTTTIEPRVRGLKVCLAAGRQGVVVLPTGAGKTSPAQLALQATQQSTLIVVPTLDLMHQWYAHLVAAL